MRRILFNIKLWPLSQQRILIIYFYLFRQCIFLQKIYAPVFGTNGPLWSLTNEFWYYILFPFIMIVMGRVNASFKRRLIIGLLLLFIVYFIAQSLLVGFVIWLLGVIVHVAYYKQQSTYSLWFVVVSFGLFMVSLVDSKMSIIHTTLNIPSDLFVGILFSLFLISINNKSVSSRYRKYIAGFSKWLSEISYTLYLFHFPIVMLIYAIFYSKRQLTLNSYGVIQYFLWMITIFSVSYALWWVFERNTSKVRQFFKARIIKN
ncbi:MAG TPA: hypothetical protein ENI80_07730 [Acidiferrobacteraceae bacterium]|nr:hypothetical protein [Acidiferrobacteraceae bacterium]